MCFPLTIYHSDGGGDELKGYLMSNTRMQIRKFNGVRSKVLE
jgi:hypothetical protein